MLPVLLLGALAPGLAACGNDPIGGNSPSVASIDLAEKRIEYRSWRRQVSPLEAEALRVGQQARSRLRSAEGGPAAVAAVRRGEAELERIVLRLEEVKVARGPLVALHRRVIARVRAAAEGRMAEALRAGDARAAEAAVGAARADAERLQDLEDDIVRYARSLGVDPSTGDVVAPR